MAKELLLDDQSRFNKVMEMFPENFIDDFVNYFLFNGKYEVETNDLLDRYNLYSREVLSEFIDENINQAWQQFNESFYTLRHFLGIEFDIPQAHFEMYDKPPFLYLKPAWHHNFHESFLIMDAKEMSIKWGELLDQLRKLSEDFEKNYKNFVRIASMSFATSKNKVSIKNNNYSIKISPKDKEKLKFYSDTGDISYKNEDGEVKDGSKGFALLSFLNNNKNTPFTIDDIKQHCNSLVNKSVHYFKKEKDIDDTIRLIKSKLKVSKNAYFPIAKRGSEDNKKWLWVEK